MNKNLATILGKATYNINKNATTILTGIGITGMISTAIMASRATLIAQDILKEKEKEFEIGPNKETISEVWKLYIPTLGMCTLSALCFIKANKINLQRQAAFTGLYSITESKLKEYERQVIEEVGEKKAEEIKAKATKLSESKDVILTGEGDQLCYETLSGRYFMSSIEHLKKVENDMNKRLINNYWITLNEVYYAMGMSGNNVGDSVGWQIDQFLEFKFLSKITEDGRPCILVDYEVQPIVGDGSIY